MKNLLSDLDAQAGKVPYQSYTIKHGIEAFEVLVPLAESVFFEKKISTSNFPTRQSVLEVVTAFGGRLK